MGLGAGPTFVGRAVVGGGGGLGGLGRGIAPSSLSSDDSKENFRFLGAGWASLVGGGGGVGAVVVDASPALLPLAHPAPTHAPQHLLILPPPAYPTSCIRAHSAGRKWRGATHTLLTTREVFQWWRPRKRARPKGGSRATMWWRDPRGTSWDPSASRQATRMGLAFVALTTTSITWKKKKEKINFFGDIFNFSTLILTLNF